MILSRTVNIVEQLQRHRAQQPAQMFVGRRVAAVSVRERSTTDVYLTQTATTIVLLLRRQRGALIVSDASCLPTVTLSASLHHCPRACECQPVSLRRVNSTVYIYQHSDK